MTSSPIAGPSSVAPTSGANATSAPSVDQLGLIAFVVGRGDGTDLEIQVITLDGSVVATVPRPGLSMNEAPAWEPGGRSLLFTSNRTGEIHQFRYAVATNAVTQLTFGDYFEGYVDVSPDGSTIAFDNATETVDLGIWLMDIDGSNRRELVPPPPAPEVDSAPAFSPDGTKVAFVRKYSMTPPTAREAAFIVNIDGTGLRRLTDPVLDVGRIRWSPDGTQLAFSDQTENRDEDMPQDIWLINPDGSGLHRITHNAPGTQTFDPVWSPDGSRFAVLGWRKGDDHNTIGAMNADGTALREIYAGPPQTFLGWPAWGGITK
ncbi:MAG: PD40 domain-containing protein [Chloroflexi bacterium]|nr:PD40 domain-containing protein [Chloroflexota bacterium]